MGFWCVGLCVFETAKLKQTVGPFCQPNSGSNKALRVYGLRLRGAVEGVEAETSTQTPQVEKVLNRKMGFGGPSIL